MKPSKDFDRLVQRYLDGETTSAEVSQLDQALRNDATSRRHFAEIMNLDSALASAAADWAAGRVDELLILGRVMSDEEIRSLFEAGNPYQ